jgi:hypothetical protein
MTEILPFLFFLKKNISQYLEKQERVQFDSVLYQRLVQK